MEEQNDSRDCNIQDLKNHIEIFLAVFGHDLTAFDRLISSNRQLIAGHVDIGMMILDRLCKHVIGRDILRATFIKKPELLVDLNIGYFVGLLPILSATLESYKLLEKIIISKPHILEAIPIEPFIALLNSNRRVAMVCILVKCHEGICLLQRIFSSRPQLLLSPELTNHPVFLILINILIEQKNFNFLFIILTANHHHILKLFLYSISGQKILKSISSLSPTEANIGLLNLVEHAKKAPIQARTPIRYNALNTRAKTSDCTPSLTYIPLMIDKEGSPLPCDYSPPVHHHSPGLRS